MARAQSSLVEQSREAQLAELTLRDGGGGGNKASPDLVGRCTAARTALLQARTDFSTAQAAKDAAETAVTKAEVEMAATAEGRNIMNLLFKKRDMSPAEEEEQKKLLEEPRRLKAVIAIQRNYRRGTDRRKAAACIAERRHKLRATFVNAGKAAACVVAFVIMLAAVTRTASAAIHARHAVYRAVSHTAVHTWEGARAFAPLDHGYIRYGVASGVEASENVVLREKNRAMCEKVAALEQLLEGARHALDGTHVLSPCVGCARDVAAARDAGARARAAEARADSLAVEVHTLRAMALYRGAEYRDVDAMATRTSSPLSSSTTGVHDRAALSGRGGQDTHVISQAWLTDPGVSYSAQVAAAATAAAAARSQDLVANATAAARSSEAAAEASRVELDLLRGLIHDGLLPGGASGGSGTCWAEAAEARSHATISAAADAAAHAQKSATGLVAAKLEAYSAARREAENRAQVYGMELDALRAAAPELRNAADAAVAGGEVGVSPRTRKVIVGAAKLVAAAKVASERVGEAAAALRDAEASAEARRIELDTLRHLVGGGGAEGMVSRARSMVVGAPETAAAARHAAERLVFARLRAEEEARTQAETRAEVFRVELAAVRAIEAERAREASANAGKSSAGLGSGGGWFGAEFGAVASVAGGGVLPPSLSRAGEVAALTKEVKRLEWELAASRNAAGGIAPGEPATPSAAAAIAVTAASEAAAEAAAANNTDVDVDASSGVSRTLLVRAARAFLSAVSGETCKTLDELRSQVISLERRLLAMSRAATSAAGPACNDALNDAMDARRHAESHAAALELEVAAARARTDEGPLAGKDAAGRGAVRTLWDASDRHRQLLTRERGAAKAALESCRVHASAAQQRAFVAARAAADASDLSEQREWLARAEQAEAAKSVAITRPLLGAAERAGGNATFAHTPASTTTADRIVAAKVRELCTVDPRP